jgi:hypothetical protein
LSSVCKYHIRNRSSMTFPFGQPETLAPPLR